MTLLALWLAAFCLTPSSVGVAQSVVEVDAGQFMTCERLDDGRVRCWGTGALGDGRAPTEADIGRYTSAGVGDWLEGTFDGLEVGGFACGTREGQIWCWGEWERERVRARPTHIRVPGSLLSLAVGRAHACAGTDRGVWCWGMNDHGQLGDGSTRDRARPVQVRGLRGRATEVAVGGAFSCAIVDGRAHCWGEGSGGSLGNGARDDSPRPVLATVLEGVVPVELAAASYSACARIDDGSVRCWGSGSLGELGSGREFSVARTVTVPLSGPALEVSAMEFAVCARTAVDVACWGELGAAGSSRTPTTVPLGPATVLDVGRRHACAVVSGVGWCWGDGPEGQLDGAAHGAAAPVAIPAP